MDMIIRAGLTLTTVNDEYAIDSGRVGAHYLPARLLPVTRPLSTLAEVRWLWL